ncbi:hypothetical protein H6501_01970 [Candidatus Woesearchaeota archaeon]|nr:hypothetical protein [Candidatus Woesearchaeota archaeon]USN44864.1 MAG: hypothetical protein H6500_03415 [Candidatus Woesearchaeota archaeon]
MERTRESKGIGIGFLFLVLFSVLFTLPLSSTQVFAASQSVFSQDGLVQTKTANSICAGVPADIKDSLFLSIISLCLPGILEKAREWKQMKCQKVSCVYNAVVNDLDPTFCEKQYAYQQCKYIVGEVFALPGINMFEYFRGLIAEIIANPVGAVYSATYLVAKEIISTDCTLKVPADKVPFLCNIIKNPPLLPAKIFVGVTDLASVAQTLKDIFQNGISLGFDDDEQDYCSGIGSIKEEMQKVVKNQATSLTETDDTTSADEESSEEEE